jgi:hypothetical protein
MEMNDYRHLLALCTLKGLTDVGLCSVSVF